MVNLIKYQRNHTCRKRTCLLPPVPHVLLQCETLLENSFRLFGAASLEQTWRVCEVSIDDRSSRTSQKR